MFTQKVSNLNFTREVEGIFIHMSAFFIQPQETSVFLNGVVYSTPVRFSFYTKSIHFSSISRLENGQYS